MEQKNYSIYINTPIGWLQLQSNKEALLAISFVESEGNSSKLQPPILQEVSNQLLQYFRGKRKEFDLPIAPEGTEFQHKVWGFVKKVKFGETASYLNIAIKTGSEKNTRAVGLANGKNPIPIIIPCHRIIGTNGKLTGYAGGLNHKRWLLHHELRNTKNTGLLF